MHGKIHKDIMGSLPADTAGTSSFSVCRGASRGSYAEAQLIAL